MDDESSHVYPIESCEEFRALFYYELVDYEEPFSLQTCPSAEQFDVVYGAFLHGFYTKGTHLLTDSTAPQYYPKAPKFNTHEVGWRLFECVIMTYGDNLDEARSLFRLPILAN